VPETGRTLRRIVLAKPIEGLPRPADFRLEEVPVPDLADGWALARTLRLSVDPGTRSRLSGGASYAAPLRPGETIDSFAVAEVVESRSARLAPGDIVAAGAGWADHILIPPRGYLQTIRETSLPLSAWIGVLGVPGMTAWFGLKRIGAIRPGDRVCVTSAAGPVGATAAQLARVFGASGVVGIAGGPEKTRWLEETCRVTAIDYRRRPDIAAAVSEQMPEGIDILFDNVGGAQLDSLIPLMRPSGRIVISGQLALYNADDTAGAGLKNTRFFISSRLRMEGLVVFDDLRGFPEAQGELAALIRAGEVAWREIAYAGLEAAPQAFIDLFTADGFGRRIIHVAEPG